MFSNFINVTRDIEKVVINLKICAEELSSVWHKGSLEIMRISTGV
jgi:hypothetical protein